MKELTIFGISIPTLISLILFIVAFFCVYLSLPKLELPVKFDGSIDNWAIRNNKLKLEVSVWNRAVDIAGFRMISPEVCFWSVYEGISCTHESNIGEGPCNNLSVCNTVSPGQSIEFHELIFQIPEKHSQKFNFTIQAQSKLRWFPIKLMKRSYSCKKIILKGAIADYYNCTEI